MSKICPERRCPRREACQKSNGHAVIHEHNRFCDTGCTLHPNYENKHSRTMHRCISC